MAASKGLVKEKQDAIKIDPQRYAADIESACFIYSRSKNRWYKGQIVDIYDDAMTNKEWLVVKYSGNKTKKIQRLCKDFRPNTVQGLWQIDLIYGYINEAQVKLPGDLICLLIKYYDAKFGDTWNVETSHSHYKINTDYGIISCSTLKPSAFIPPYLNAFGTNIVSKGEIAKWKLKVVDIAPEATDKPMNIIFGIVDVTKAPLIKHSISMKYCDSAYAAGIGYHIGQGIVYDGTGNETDGIDNALWRQIVHGGFKKFWYVLGSSDTIEMTLDMRDKRGGKLSFNWGLYEDDIANLFSDEIDLERQYQVALAIPKGQKIVCKLSSVHCVK